MRTNLPVTNNEVVVREDQMIVSKTDLKGQITYVNRDFLDISGFTEAELMGAPHNIVRHPDMPPAAFDDLWKTLKSGRPWIGLVKNRCKNGDFYWVEAHAAPLCEGGQVVGYVSMRKKPTRTQVEEAERIYRLIREGKAGNVRVEQGSVVSGASLAEVFSNMSVKSRLLLVMGALAVTLLVQGAAGLFNLSKDNEVIDRMYDQRLVPLLALARIQSLMQDNRNHLLLGLQHNPSNPLAKMHDHPLALHTDQVAKNRDEITALWKDYMERVKTDEHKLLAEAYLKARSSFVEEGIAPARKALLEGRWSDANAVMLEKTNPLFEKAYGQAEALVKYHRENAARDNTAQVEYYGWIRNLTITLILAVLAAAGFLALLLVRSIMRPLDAAIGAFQNIAQGKYDNPIAIRRNDEPGRLLQNLEIMQNKLAFDIAEAKRIADENLRIKIGLDNVATNVMIANHEHHIIYMNKAVQQMFDEAETDIRKDLPNFESKKLLGANIDIFHKNPAHQREALARLTGTHRATIKLGGRTFNLAVTPVRNERGDRLGSAVEWLDRTGEVAIENEVADLVTAAANGDFTKRLATEGKQGFFAQLAGGLNQLVEVVSAGLDDIARVLNAIAKGHLTERIEADYSGTFGQLKDDTNTTVERLRETVLRIKESTEAINTAAQEIAVGNQDLSSRTEEQASSLEETASSMEQLNATVKQNAENARQANELASTSNDIAARGGEVVKQVVHTMSGIQESSKKIADIIGVIDSIAFQTNILALNAAVEAARAGEQGRGFAVVASEVRNLAQRSATAAKEIKSLIADSVDKVEDGARQAADAGNTMDEVVTSIHRVTKFVNDIAAASREQSSGIEQVTQAVSQMDEVTQQNAALVEEAAAAAESLEEQARSLVQAVSIFRLSTADLQQAEGAPRAELAPVTRIPAAKEKPAASKTGGPLPKVRKVAGAGGAGDLEDEWEEF